MYELRNREKNDRWILLPPKYRLKPRPVFLDADVDVTYLPGGSKESRTVKCNHPYRSIFHLPGIPSIHVCRRQCISLPSIHHQEEDIPQETFRETSVFPIDARSLTKTTKERNSLQSEKSFPTTARATEIGGGKPVSDTLNILIVGKRNIRHSRLLHDKHTFLIVVQFRENDLLLKKK